MTSQPRAHIWMLDSAALGAGQSYTAGQWSEDIERARLRLQQKLRGTGLVLVGLAVIEEVDSFTGNVKLSWKVFSGQYASSEADCA